MEKPKINVLIAENNLEGSFFWERIIAEIRDMDIDFIHIGSLSDILKYLGNGTPDVILLDLSLPENGGFEVFLLIIDKVPAIPIIVVTGTDNQKLAIQTTLEGAQDCLVKNDINGYLMSRSIRYAIGRQRHLKQVRAFSTIDELTGLYNRRGFLMRAEEKIKIAGQTNQNLFLVFADVDGLKTINDTLGHHLGDIAIMETAHVLRAAFRETDILGRLSGDEFVALLTCTDDVREDALVNRFQETMDEHNGYPERAFKLSASLGIALYDPKSPCSLGDLLAHADSLMYKRKKVKKGYDFFRLFVEMKELACSVLTVTQDETIVRSMIPILRTCGLDRALAVQLSSWIVKGSRELKLSLIGLIEEMGDALGGRALQMALFDDSEDIAASAARTIGKIHFIAGLPSLLKVANLQEILAPKSEGFFTVVCRSLGDLAQPEGMAFLQEIAGNRHISSGKNFSLSVRLEAIQAMSQINRLETSRFVEGLAREKNPQLQESLRNLMQEIHSVREDAETADLNNPVAL